MKNHFENNDANAVKKPIRNYFTDKQPEIIVPQQQLITETVKTVDKPEAEIAPEVAVETKTEAAPQNVADKKNNLLIYALVAATCVVSLLAIILGSVAIAG
jgi:hypothetical protein